MSDTCKVCGADYILDFGGDDDGLCHDCAHRISTLAREYAATLHLEHERDTSVPCNACRVRSEAHAKLIEAAETK